MSSENQFKLFAIESVSQNILMTFYFDDTMNTNLYIYCYKCTVWTHTFDIIWYIISASIHIHKSSSLPLGHQVHLHMNAVAVLLHCTHNNVSSLIQPNCIRNCILQWENISVFLQQIQETQPLHCISETSALAKHQYYHLFRNDKHIRLLMVLITKEKMYHIYLHILSCVYIAYADTTNKLNTKKI